MPEIQHSASGDHLPRRDPRLPIGFEKAYALQTDLNMDASEIISTYVYKKGLIDGDYSFSTAVGLFNTVINVILLITVNEMVKKMNEGKGMY